jgi:hypothetical protein
LSITALQCASYWHHADVERGRLLNQPLRDATWQAEWDRMTQLAHNAARVLANVIHPANEDRFEPGSDAA